MSHVQYNQTATYPFAAMTYMKVESRLSDIHDDLKITYDESRVFKEQEYNCRAVNSPYIATIKADTPKIKYRSTCRYCGAPINNEGKCEYCGVAHQYYDYNDVNKGNK